MKLRELLEKLDNITVVILDGAEVEGYSDTLRLVLNDAMLTGEVTEVTARDDKIRVWVEVQNENA